MNPKSFLNRCVPVILVIALVVSSLSAFAAPKKKAKKPKTPAVAKTNTVDTAAAAAPAVTAGAAADAAPDQGAAAKADPDAPIANMVLEPPAAANAAPAAAPAVPTDAAPAPDMAAAPAPAPAPAPTPADAAPAPAPVAEAAPAPPAAAPAEPAKAASDVSTGEVSYGNNMNSQGWVFNLPAKSSGEVKWWRDSQENLDDRLAWFRDARFGMFIHWGVYSGLGNRFHGKPGGGYAEHIQRVLKIPIVQYRDEVAANFNPTNFNADEWVRLARDAGMKYIVITSKHHDGFAMWPTKVNHYNIMEATAWKHDPMADLKAACDKYGIKFGFYYSQAFDWGNSNAPGNDWDVKNPGGDKKIGGKNWWETKPEFMASARQYVDEKAIPQLRELIQMYHPAILWFDTSSKLPPSENLRIMKAVREADPNVVISGRLVNNWGDYDDTTDRPANFPPHDGDWEGIPTTNESYGWNPNDNSHKPPAHFIQLLAKASARGGNVLLNIGPMGDGNIDPKDVAILRGIGDWWKGNSESIRHTMRTPLPVQTWGESTVSTNPVPWQLAGQKPGSKRIYLHVFDWPRDGKLVVGGLKSEVLPDALSLDDVDKVMHGTGAVRHITGLKVTRLNANDVSIAVPAEAPNSADSVIVLSCVGDIAADKTRLLQPSFPTDVLRAFDGQLHGGLKFGPGKKTDDVAQEWTRADQSVSWAVRLNEPANYQVSLNYDGTNNVANTFVVHVGSESLEGAVQQGNNRFQTVGTVSLQPGNFEISVAPKELKGGELFRLRSVELKSTK